MPQATDREYGPDSVDKLDHATDPASDGAQVPLSIRTTRYLHYADGRWWQFHHHGSIDDAAALAAYQAALA